MIRQIERDAEQANQAQLVKDATEAQILLIHGLIAELRRQIYKLRGMQYKITEHSWIQVEHVIMQLEAQIQSYVQLVNKLKVNCNEWRNS